MVDLLVADALSNLSGISNSLPCCNTLCRSSNSGKIRSNGPIGRILRQYDGASATRLVTLVTNPVALLVFVPTIRPTAVVAPATPVPETAGVLTRSSMRTMLQSQQSRSHLHQWQTTLLLEFHLQPRQGIFDPSGQIRHYGVQDDPKTN